MFITLLEKIILHLNFLNNNKDHQNLLSGQQKVEIEFFLQINDFYFVILLKKKFICQT